MGRAGDELYLYQAAFSSLRFVRYASFCLNAGRVSRGVSPKTYMFSGHISADVLLRTYFWGLINKDVFHRAYLLRCFSPDSLSGCISNLGHVSQDLFPFQERSSSLPFWPEDHGWPKSSTQKSPTGGSFTLKEIKRWSSMMVLRRKANRRLAVCRKRLL